MSNDGLKDLIEQNRKDFDRQYSRLTVELKDLRKEFSDLKEHMNSKELEFSLTQERTASTLKMISYKINAFGFVAMSVIGVTSTLIVEYVKKRM